MGAPRALLLAAAVACSVPGATPAAWTDRFRDESDGAFDISDHLLKYRGALPVPLVVTEPAVGYGGGLALAYFSQSFAERAEASRARGEPVQPPDIAIGAAAATENGTWLAGAAYMGFWDADRWRYVGGVGKTELHLDYFSVSGQPRAYRLDGAALIQQVLRRVGTSNWFAGARYVHVATDSRFEAALPDDVPARALDLSLGITSAVLDYDSRDNIFTPNRGVFFEMEAGFARGAFGSDANYETLNTRAFAWHPVGDFVLGLRGDARLSRGDVPFFAQPYVSLRGVPAARYQDRNAVVLEGEARWNVTPRWALVAFGGAGKAYGRRQSWDQAETVGAGGLGFRYLFARKLNLYAGIDVARGPEDTAFYLTAGSAWR